MLGLFAFFYGVLHFTTYMWLDKFFDVAGDAQGRRETPLHHRRRPGIAAMTPLAVTSTAGWIRRLGGRNWQRLHRLIYLSAAAGVVHYWWLVKSDIRAPAAYAAALAILLVTRFVGAGFRPAGHRPASRKLGSRQAVQRDVILLPVAEQGQRLQVHHPARQRQFGQAQVAGRLFQRVALERGVFGK